MAPEGKAGAQRIRNRTEPVLELWSARHRGDRHHFLSFVALAVFE
jgi:hypothetical protein